VAQPLIDRLGIERGDLVALVGAGGKTTLAHRLVDEAMVRGWRVVFTTTTRIGADQHGGHVVTGPEQAPAVLERTGVCVVASPDGAGKLAGPAPAEVERLRADLVVVEADGARGMRAKAPGWHEPVIPATARVVVAVIAADALDRVIEDACHRPLRVGAVVGAGPYDRLTPERAARLLASPEGGRKAVPDGARFVVVVTRADPAEAERVQRVAALLAPIPVVEVAST
jgi:molybdenum cofactor cytidylyltransferase